MSKALYFHFGYANKMMHKLFSWSLKENWVGCSFTARYIEVGCVNLDKHDAYKSLQSLSRKC